MELPFAGPIEIDETYIGGKRRNMTNAERKKLAGTGRGAVGKVAVVGAKDRGTNKIHAKVVPDTGKESLHDFVSDSAAAGAIVYTDDAAAYDGIPNPHQSVTHSDNEYVRGPAHTNGIESSWSMLKRAHKGTFHQISSKHLQRYVSHQGVFEPDWHGLLTCPIPGFRTWFIEQAEKAWDSKTAIRYALESGEPAERVGTPGLQENRGVSDRADGGER